MARTESTMLELGTPAPEFSLPDVTTGRDVGLADFVRSRAVLVMFISRHCPYVQHVKGELARLGKDYTGRPLGIVAIASNDVALYPDDAPERLRELAAELGLDYPVLFDQTQAVAKSYGAACTPDFFLFDADRRLVYRGQLDGSRPSNGVPLTGTDLRRAIDAVLAGLPVPSEQKPSLGCNIKWRPGNEPPYFQH